MTAAEVPILHEDFIEMIDRQMWACAAKAALGIALVLAFSTGAYYAASAAVGTIRAHRKAMGDTDTLRVATDLLQDADNDNYIPPRKPDTSPEPEGIAFRRTLDRRRNDPRLPGYQRAVEAACKKRVVKDGSIMCEVDKGVGGGDAATFDPAFDDYKRYSKDERRLDVDDLLEIQASEDRSVPQGAECKSR